MLWTFTGKRFWTLICNKQCKLHYCKCNVPSSDNCHSFLLWQYCLVLLHLLTMCSYIHAYKLCHGFLRAIIIFSSFKGYHYISYSAVKVVENYHVTLPENIIYFLYSYQYQIKIYRWIFWKKMKKRGRELKRGEAGRRRTELWNRGSPRPK